MSNSIHLISLLLLASGLSIQAQEKRAMTFDEMVGWERISEQRISDNGKWVFCKMEPWRGDATILLYNDKGEEKGSFKPAAKAQFSSSSEYLLVTKTPPLKEVEAEKLKKTDKDKMPMNSLIISRLSGGMETIDSLKSYKLSETADWLAYQRGSKKDSMLYIRSLDGMQQDSFPAVSDFGFAQKGNVLYVVSDSVLYTYIPQKGNNRISDKKGVFKKIAFNENGSKLAYLFCPHKDSAATWSSLYLAENNTPGKLIAERGDKAFPASWIISENAPLYFSENASRLFFGTAPEPKQKDTTLLAENRPDVQVWSWDEKVQYTQQSFNKATDLKRSYTAIYNLGSGRLLQLATEELPTLQTADEGNAIWALLSTTRPYGTQSMWTARQFHDIYIINLETGERRQIKEKSPSYMRFSPKGKYTYWYQDQDSSWYTRSTADGKEYRLTTPQTFAAWDEDNDVPDYPSPYGIAGWTDDDQSILIKDRYDIWKFDPIAASSPVNLTVNGRKEQITYSLIQLDREKRAYNTSEAQYLTGFNERTKGSGYYTTRLNKPVAPKALLAGNFKLAALAKAKDANAVIYTQETYEQYPDIQLSNLSFKKSIRLTDGIRQQDSIIWGTAELKNRPEIASVTRAGGSLLFAWLQQIIVENKDGSESYYSSVQYMGEEDLLQTLNLQIHQGLAPREAMQKYDQPVYINRRYADILIPAGENPVGQLVSRYDKSFQNVLAGDPKQACTICGIVSDLYINTLEEEAMPSLIYLNNAGNQHYRTLYVRLNEKQKKEGMETLQAVWKKVNPNEYFTYIDVYEVFMQRNRRTTDMANLLLMYSIISILLTCFGLFGMALYATKQRTKEIGIRKVNGASTRSIMLLLIRQFVKWIAVAFVIATPLAWVLLNRWLESFANRISISPLYFLMGGGIVLAITLLTVGWHSYRAASSNPVKSLKSE